VHEYRQVPDHEITVLSEGTDLVAKVQPIYRLDRPEAQTAADASRMSAS
jgi:hypothetical protein